MHRYARNEPHSNRERHDDRDGRGRPHDDDPRARDRDDRGSRERDDDRDSRERDDQYRWATDRDNFGGGPGGADMRSAGWGRDDYGFRGPSFREGARNRAELHDRGSAREQLRDPGMPRRDRWNSAGGYSEQRQHPGPRPMQGDDVRYGSGPVPGEGAMRTSHRGKGPKNFSRSDERIRECVCELLEDSEVDASDIDVRVLNGEVTLEGTVDDRRAKREAEDIACEARGVKDVHNLLRVGNREESAAQSPSNGTRASSSGNGERASEARRS